MKTTGYIVHLFRKIEFATEPKYLNNIVEQDHRRVKQKTRAALGFKAFYSAHATVVGVELIHMIRKGQVRPIPGGSFIEQFNQLAM